MTSIYVASIKDIISSHLIIDNKAQFFFENDLSNVVIDRIVVDFSQVKSISNSFAHQYLVSKRASKMKVIEINVPPNVCRIMSLIQREIEEKKRKKG